MRERTSRKTSFLDISSLWHACEKIRKSLRSAGGAHFINMHHFSGATGGRMSGKPVRFPRLLLSGVRCIVLCDAF